MIVGLFLFLFGVFQNTTPADTAKFSFAEYVQLVSAHHPIAKQAQIIYLMAKADSLKERGVLDPKLQYDFSNKNFDGTEYYKYSIPSLTIPTITGVDIKLGVENTSGTYLNPESRVPEDGKFAAGIVVPIGRGIVNNERSITLKQAQNYVRLSEAERDLTLLKLFRDAALTYGDWYFSYRALQFAVESYQLATFRYGFIQESYRAGDMAAIDTLEALNEIVKRSLILRQDSLDVAKSIAYLNNYVWNSEGLPAILADKVLPELSLREVVENEPDWLALNANIEVHPVVAKQKIKTVQASLDRRFFSTQRMPDVNLNYFPLFDVGDSDLQARDVTNNEKASISMTVPLFFRKERGQFQKAKQKESYENLELDVKMRYLAVTLDATSRQWNILRRQIEDQRKLVQLDKDLLRAEQQKFDAGESSLFIINSRERRLLENQLYLVELEHKLFNLYIELQYLNGDVRL